MPSTAIWKFGLNAERTIAATFDIPAGAKFLATANQHEGVAIWFEVDPAADTEARTFRLVLTGESPVPNSTHLGTVLLDQGAFVVHLYEVHR